MGIDTVTFFKPYPFEKGQKIRIDGGPRNGDWLVADISDRKITLKCPVSGREFEWNRFCYFTEARDSVEWPQKD